MSGSKFARSQLLKCGWTEGKGLGKDEEGMRESIKVHVKNNRTGIGSDPGKEFTHHWWDDVFNKTAKSIRIETDQEGSVTLKRKAEEKSAASEKKKKKMALYGNFVKGATLKQEGGTQVEEKDGSSSESEEEAETAAPKHTLKLPEDELFELCGGRTAHKGARHGLQLSGKLLRIEAMERDSLQNLNEGKKKKSSSEKRARQKEEGEESVKENGNCDIQNGDYCDEADGKRKRKKKKKKTGLEEEFDLENEKLDSKNVDILTKDIGELSERVSSLKSDTCVPNECDLDGNESAISKRKKKKKKDKSDENCETEAVKNEDENLVHPKKKKKKKNKKKGEEYS